MAKKQFIRHLEFYGFPDQNGYSSDINGGGVDLSEIIEKNKEQDSEIKELEGEKADKKDLDELSGTVESLIAVQSEINQGFANAISGIADDINSLKEADNEFGEQISAMTDAVTDLMEDVEKIDESISGLNESISELSGNLETFKEDVKENYLKKEEAYTKEEIDSMISSGISGYATTGWVESQGYITEETADGKYASIGELESVIETLSGVSNDIDAVSGELETFKDKTNENIEKLSGDVADLQSEISGKTSQKDFSDLVDVVSGMSNVLDTKASQIDVETISGAVDTLSDKIDTISGDIETLFEDIDSISGVVDDKADIRYVDETRQELQANIDVFSDVKADKVDVEFVSGAVDTLSDKIDNEIARAISAETQLNSKIDDVKDIAESAATKVDSYETRVYKLETGLTQEIADRKQADIDLIGTSGDSKDLDTIWAAKNYAKYMKGEAVSESKIYTDNKVTTFTNALDDLREWAEQNFSSAATTGYVEERIAETKATITSEFDQKINTEKEERIQKDNNLDIAINDVRVQTINNTSKISYNSSRLNAITSWEGTNPEEYDNSGNGVLDVLHREFHEFVESYDPIKSIEVVDGNLVITFYTKGGGTEQTIIPLSEIIDLDNYYTKEETDAKIAEAIAQIDLSNYYTKEETDEKVAEVDAKAEENKTNIASLFDKLGYTDNDTLTTTNQHEVAFGEYNVSNTDTEPSGQTIFTIGNGTNADNRSNALEVRKNGDVYMWIEGEYMQINRLLGMLAHEVYDDDTNNG